MCGILFSSFDPGVSFKLIKYRGPDNTGSNKFIAKYEINSETKTRDLYFQHHRLAINYINNVKANQPITKKGCILLFAGEIYNHKEIEKKYANELFNSDGESIVYAYKESKLEELDGDFAFVLYDNILKKVIIGRDYVGLIPLVYYNKNNQLIVSSEVKVIEDILKNNGIQYGKNDIKNFPINSTMTFDLTFDKYDTSIINKTMYTNSVINEDELTIKENIYKLLYSSVYKRIMNSERKVGILCSGGIDSSIILLLIKKMIDDGLFGSSIPELNIFTLGLGTVSYDYYYMSIMVKNMGLENNVKFIEFNKENSVELIDEIIYKYETYDAKLIHACIPMYVLAKYIAENSDCKVILSGEGADELFMGYSYFRNFNEIEGMNESISMIKDMHSFDILRAERSFSSNGLELRVPYLDKSFVDYVLKINGSLRKTKLEKQLLRDSFEELFYEYGVPSLLTRNKECLSDGVDMNWNNFILNYVTKELCKNNTSNTDDKMKLEKEYYKSRYDSMFKTEHLLERKEIINTQIRPIMEKVVDSKDSVKLDNDISNLMNNRSNFKVEELLPKKELKTEKIEKSNVVFDLDAMMRERNNMKF